jgi:poly(hydroxyalkanoate) depolymerase family esterase
MTSRQISNPIPVLDRVSMRTSLRLGTLAALAVGLLAGAPSRAEIRSGEVDGYRYRLFIPEADAPVSAKPLLVVLHGCEQSAEDIARVGRFDALAASRGFVALYPETHPSLTNPYGCWRWWAPENQIRAGGEPEAIVHMVSEASAAIGVDRERIFVVGLSSGGAMSAILGALFPEIFAAVGVHSGMAYAAASTASCALRALSDGAVAAESRATIAYNAQGRQHRPMPLMVIQGSEDDVVAPENAGLLIQQFAQLADLADDGDGANQSIDALPDSTREDRIAEGRLFRIRVYLDAHGDEIMHLVTVEGMGHAWSGGAPGLEFSDPRGPDAALLFWSFFEERSIRTPQLRIRQVAECREHYGANFAHYWWYGRMSLEEYRCDPWRWTWRRGYEGEWTEGRCP